MPPTGTEDFSTENKRLKLTRGDLSEEIWCECNEDQGDWSVRNGEVPKTKENEEFLLEDNSQECCGSLSFISDDSSLCSSTENFPFPEAPLETGTPESVDSVNSFMIEVTVDAELGDSSTNMVQRQDERSRERSLSLADIPHWGLVSICGRRPEMEDATAVIPRFIDLPLWMEESGNSSVDSGLDGHFFGVYDGHGGAQVIFLKR